MTCKTMRPSAWVLAAPFLPFVAAACMSRKHARGTSCSRPMGYDAGRGHAGGRETAAPRTAKHTRRAADIVDTAIAAGSFSTLVQAIETADLVDVLKGEGPFTVFAPTDDAFGRLPEGALDQLLEDKSRLADVLKLHVTPGRLTTTALAGVAAVKTVQGESLEVDASLGLKIGSAYVIQSDVETANGVVHAIDSVLLPESER